MIQDARMRATGHRVWVFEYLRDGLVATEDPAEATEHFARNAWDAYLVMVAAGTEEAKRLFYDAQDQCNAFVNGVEDWVNVVHFPAETRPEVGKVHGRNQGDVYKNWSEEYLSRYGIPTTAILQGEDHADEAANQPRATHDA